MSNKLMDQSITILDIDSKVLTKLKTANINTIKDVWQLKRKDLKQHGLNDSEIKQIVIKLQLHSIDLNKKIYNKN